MIFITKDEVLINLNNVIYVDEECGVTNYNDKEYFGLRFHLVNGGTIHDRYRCEKELEKMKQQIIDLMNYKKIESKT